MKKQPVIGIISAKHDMGGILPVYGTNAHYLEQTAAAGGIPVQLPVMAGMPEEALGVVLSRCDGFLLPGGADIEAAWYGEELLPNLTPDSGELDHETQKTALRMIRMAVTSGKPVLGICLGMQVLNVAMGGSLYQDIPTQIPSELVHANPMKQLEDRWHLAHSVCTEEGSLIRRLYGTERMVNSFHHQAVKQIAPGFHVTAYAPDGVAEAMEYESGRILAVQWHPENLSHAGMPEARNLFRWLAETAGE